MLEKTVEQKLIKGVRKMGGEAFKFVSPGNDGVPDRLVLLPGGKIYFVELKAERGQLRPTQKVQLVRLSALGQQVYVLHGAAEVESWLDQIAIENCIGEGI